MNSPSEWLNSELEQTRRGGHPARQNGRPSQGNPEVKALAALARSLQEAVPLQADPDFANYLERRIQARQATLQRKHAAPHWWGNPFFYLLRAHPALRIGVSLLLVVMLLGTGIFVAAAQVTNPNNPLYGLKHWEQQVQVSLSGSPADQAELELQSARDRLNTLPSLANTAHGGEYRQALAKFDEQFRQAVQTVNALPAGQDHTRLAGELDTLQTDARHMLRGFLLHLAVPEGQATTDELGRLGETVPHLTQVDLTLPAHPNGQASISISGDDLQAGAKLLIDGRLVTASGALQNGSYLFTLTWKGDQHPHSIGIKNPDGTIAQTTTITVHSTSDSNDNNGNGNGGKPDGTPTPPRTLASPSGGTIVVG